MASQEGGNSDNMEAAMRRFQQQTRFNSGNM